MGRGFETSKILAGPISPLPAPPHPSKAKVHKFSSQPVLRSFLSLLGAVLAVKWVFFARIWWGRSKKIFFKKKSTLWPVRAAKRKLKTREWIGHAGEAVVLWFHSDQEAVRAGVRLDDLRVSPQMVDLNI